MKSFPVPLSTVCPFTWSKIGWRLFSQAKI